ncbi:MAG TPA: hypothetical protein VGI24_12920 [Solirubrobacteraceae bacterium]|jgi:hypothetical protein
MIAMLANALPENTGDGYVAAAYIVFFVLLMVYLAIMALRLSHVQRDLRNLQARTQESARQDETADRGAAGAAQGGQEAGGDTRGRDGQTLEREPA